MSKSKKVKIQESEAAASIEPHATDFTSKAALMAQGYAAMAAMDASTLEAVLAQIGQEAAQVDPNAADENRASIEPHGTGVSEAIKEDLTNLFGSYELTEDFKSKMSVIFEASVNARVTQIEESLKEAHAEVIEEEMSSLTEALVANVDKYLTLAAETFIQKNQLAIDNSIRAELAEDFIGGLFKLFAEHNFRIPDQQVDVVEAMAEKLEAVEEAYNDLANENIELTEIAESLVREKIVDEVAQGLVLAQGEKLQKLAEGVEFTSVEDFREKVALLKEHHFPSKAGHPVKEVALFEDAQEDQQPISEEAVDSRVASLAKLMAVSKSDK